MTTCKWLSASTHYLKEPQAVHEFCHQFRVFEPQDLGHVAQQEAQLFDKQRPAQRLSTPVAEHVQQVGHEVALHKEKQRVSVNVWRMT